MRRLQILAATMAMALLAMIAIGATTTQPSPTTQSSRPTKVRAAGASTTPSDGNKRAHPAGYGNCEKRVAAMNGSADIVFIGDSITDNFTASPTPKWDEVGKAVWDKHYSGRNVLNFGVGSDRTEHVLWRLENMDVKSLRPRVAVILIGTNNFMDTPENIAAGVKAVMDKTREVFGGPKIILISILPNHRAGPLMDSANQLIKQFADGKDVIWFDLASKMTPEGGGWKGIGKDKLHLSPEGYEMWASEMEPILTRLCLNTQ